MAKKIENNADFWFNGRVADKFGVNAALILNRIIWSINSHIGEPTKYKTRYFINGVWWMNNTQENLSNHFGKFMSIKVIRDSINSLKEAGILVAARMKSANWNQEYWYSVNETAYMELLGMKYAPEEKGEGSEDQEAVKPNEIATCPNCLMHSCACLPKVTFEGDEREASKVPKGQIEGDEREGCLLSSLTSMSTTSSTENSLAAKAAERDSSGKDQEDTDREFSNRDEEKIPEPEPIRGSGPLPPTPPLADAARFQQNAAGDNSAMGKLRQNAEQKKRAAEKATVNTRFAAKKAKAKIPDGMSEEEWEESKCSLEFHQVFVEAMQAAGYFAPKASPAALKQWKTGFFPKVHNVENGSRVIHWTIGNWAKVAKSFKLSGVPNVGFFLTNMMDQVVSELLRPAASPVASSPSAASMPGGEKAAGSWTAALEKRGRNER